MTEASAQALRQSPSRRFLAQPWPDRLLATAGILLMTIGLFVPFARQSLMYTGYPPHSYMQTWALVDTLRFSLGPHFRGSIRLLAALGITALVTVLEFGGLALIPLLWQQLSSRASTWWRWTHIAWLLALTVLVGLGIPGWWRLYSHRNMPDTLGSMHLVPGVAVFPLGLLLSVLALPLVRRDMLSAAVPVPAARTPLQWVAALTVTTGVLIWGVGFYLMPMTTSAACPPVTFSVTQFARGACAGLDSDQALATAHNTGLNPLAVLFYSFSDFRLLVALGCITAFLAWGKRQSAASLAWLAVWPVQALGVALVALQGVGVIAHTGFRLTAATGDGWHMAAGMVVTFAGLAIVVLGDLGLWREMRQRR